MNNGSIEQIGVHIMMKKVFLYEDRMDSFGSSTAQKAVTSLIPKNEQPIFEGDDLNWLNLDENEVNATTDIEENQNLTPLFRYEGHLSPSSSHGGSRSGGDGGNRGANKMGASIPLDHQLITSVIVVVVPLLKKTEEVDMPGMNIQGNRHKLIIA
ncbi:hypothetical protein Cgig2_030798 [Carnegiea gigantea]|uniref:Uncharacterized protein n=1 Tax=Carnegiea gigantea TaxID=171969 RepID=A0A9Q1KT46_9CARY|nr:hypothetical protein Cgig2_030798 [Carnegiea gigantea]